MTPRCLRHSQFYWYLFCKFGIQICKKRYNLIENEQNMSFQSEGGYALDFFKNVQYDFEA
jgi:hypothetical protein